MNTRVERKGLIRLVKASFEQVARNPDLKNKWVASESWLKLIKESNLGGKIVQDLQLNVFTKLIKKEYSVTDNTKSINSYGVYTRYRKMKNGKGKTAQKNITCFLVCEPGCLPSETESQWYYFITAASQASPASPASFPGSSSPAADFVGKRLDQSN